MLLNSFKITLHSSPFWFIYDAKLSVMLNLVTVQFCPWRNHSGCVNDYKFAYSRSTTLCVKTYTVILNSVIKPLEVITKWGVFACKWCEVITKWGVFTCKWCEVFNVISVCEKLKFVGCWQCSFSRRPSWDFWSIKKWWLTVNAWMDSWYWMKFPI